MTEFNEQSFRIIDWLNVDGDNTLSINYPLTSESVVFDVGGYKGDWAEKIIKRYGCYVYIFEPVSEFVEVLKGRFKDEKKVVIVPKGLGGGNYTTVISDLQNESSVFKKSISHKTSEIEIIDIVGFLDDHKIEGVDLISINIEGGEYELLDRLLTSGRTPKFSNIQVQFHDFIEGAENKKLGIQTKLRETHYLTYQFDFVWENWRLKKSVNEFSALDLEEIYELNELNFRSLARIREAEVGLRIDRERIIIDKQELEKNVHKLAQENEDLKSANLLIKQELAATSLTYKKVLKEKASKISTRLRKLKSKVK